MQSFLEVAFHEVIWRSGSFWTQPSSRAMLDIIITYLMWLLNIGNTMYWWTEMYWKCGIHIDFENLVWWSRVWNNELITFKNYRWKWQYFIYIRLNKNTLLKLTLPFLLNCFCVAIRNLKILYVTHTVFVVDYTAPEFSWIFCSYWKIEKKECRRL